jgi:hypothetical protein
MISGVVGSKSTSMPAMAKRAPDKTKRTSRAKRFSRWVNNELIEFELYFLPYVEALLESLAHRTLLLAIDGSDVG